MAHFNRNYNLRNRNNNNSQSNNRSNYRLENREPITITLDDEEMRSIENQQIEQAIELSIQTPANPLPLIESIDSIVADIHKHPKMINHHKSSFANKTQSGFTSSEIRCELEEFYHRLICVICYCFPYNPVFCSNCNKYMCNNCFEMSKVNPNCKCISKVGHTSRNPDDNKCKTEPVPPPVQTLLNNSIYIKCRYGCKKDDGTDLYLYWKKGHDHHYYADHECPKSRCNRCNLVIVNFEDHNTPDNCIKQLNNFSIFVEASNRHTFKKSDSKHQNELNGYYKLTCKLKSDVKFFKNENTLLKSQIEGLKQKLINKPSAAVGDEQLKIDLINTKKEFELFRQSIDKRFTESERSRETADINTAHMIDTEINRLNKNAIKLATNPTDNNPNTATNLRLFTSNIKNSGLSQDSITLSHVIYFLERNFRK